MVSNDEFSGLNTDSLRHRKVWDSHMLAKKIKSHLIDEYPELPVLLCGRYQVTYFLDDVCYHQQWFLGGFCFPDQSK